MKSVILDINNRDANKVYEYLLKHFDKKTALGDIRMTISISDTW